MMKVTSADVCRTQGLTKLSPWLAPDRTAQHSSPERGENR